MLAMVLVTEDAATEVAPVPLSYSCRLQLAAMLEF